MPKLCSLQKETNTMIWNTGAGGTGRHDLAPVCKWTGTPTPPEPTPEPVPDDRDNVTVAPEEWDYFLAFLESRRAGHSCGCTADFCNKIEGPGTHFHPPNNGTVTFDCTLWIAAYWHSEDQAIQNYCSHTAKDGTSPGQRAKRVGAAGGWEHVACAGSRHKEGGAALRGLQRAPQATATACSIIAFKASPLATRHQVRDGMSGLPCTTLVATTSRTLKAASQMASLPARGIGSEPSLAT